MRLRRAAMALLSVATVAVSAIVVIGASNPRADAVVGGTEVDPAGYPYFVRVTTLTRVCAGSVIARRAVVTAAHCFDNEDTTGVAVRQVGVARRPYLAEGISIHPLFDRDDHSYRYDIAVVFLIETLPSSFVTIQAGLPWDADAYSPGYEAIIMGEGQTGHDRPSDGFRVAETILRSDEYMESIYNGPFSWDRFIEPLMIGAGSAAENGCYGDSGGPLVVMRNNRPVQVGVLSGGTDPGGSADECEQATKFTELRGPILAWLGHTVPEIVPGWGGCQIGAGGVTRSSNYYGGTRIANSNPDGHYFWYIGCVVVTPPPPPPPPPPPQIPDDPQGPEPEICRKKPWLCD